MYKILLTSALLNPTKIFPAVLASFYMYGRTGRRSYFNRNPFEEGKRMKARSGLLFIVMETEN
jgi:hypothetical protein